MFSIMFVSCTFVLEYSFNTVFINIYTACFNARNILPSKIKRFHINYLLGGQIFSPSLVYSSAVLFSEKYIFLSTEKSKLIQ